MNFIDGFVTPVRHDRKDAYLALAKQAAAIFMEYGALSIMECWGEDLPRGKVTDFYLAVKAEPEENVVFSWTVWPSRAHRDEAWAKLMADPRMANMDMPFDGKRMFWGGFSPILDMTG